MEISFKFFKLTIIYICCAPVYTAVIDDLYENNNTIENPERVPTTTNICLTKPCVQSAALMLTYMDDTVDPCDDFYNFACGNFLKTTHLPDDKERVDLFSTVGDKVVDQMRVILNENILANEPNAFSLAKKFYKACMNTELIERNGSKPLLDVLYNLGGWPVLLGEQWIDTNWDWFETLKKFRNMGFGTDIVFDFSVQKDSLNSSAFIIEIDQPNALLDREFLIRGLEAKNVRAYFEYMVDCAVALGANATEAKKELMDVLNFEIALANITWPDEERRNVSLLYNLYAIKDLQQKFPFLSWLEYINELGNLHIDENEKVNLCVPDFFEQLEGLLKSTSKRTLANYFLWRAVASVVRTQNTQLKQIRQNYMTELFGIQAQNPRSKECVENTADKLPVAVGSMYIRRYFKEHNKQDASELVASIRHEFQINLQKIDWMDNATKQIALGKAKAMVEHVAYPNELNDDKVIDEYYRSLDLENDNFLTNLLKVEKFDIDHHYSWFYKSVNKTHWEKHAPTVEVNAYYSFPDNSISLRAAMLQDRFFSSDRLHYLNYAGIGQIIGHEISHGFDDRGRQFDSNGNLVDWWLSDTEDKFVKRVKCVVDQYANYKDPVTDLMLNGINNQGENIADMSGIKIAYQAYKERANKYGPEPQLPGLNYTTEQLFWIASAQTWCSLDRKELLAFQITTAQHPPHRFRVIGPFSNTDWFANDFHCAIGAQMNPVEKCSVW